MSDKPAHESMPPEQQAQLTPSDIALSENLDLLCTRFDRDACLVAGGYVHSIVIVRAHDGNAMQHGTNMIREDVIYALEQMLLNLKAELPSMVQPAHQRTQ